MRTWGNWRGLLLVSCLGLLCVNEAAFARKDFKGLFGSYRRERFTENEARDTDFGMDLMLSTLIPVTPIAQSSEDGVSYNSMNYATFFNYEGSLFFTLNYNWEITANVGYYSYETRKQNVIAGINDPTLNQSPLFHQFDMTAVPVLLGVKYRFSREDVVPYLGIAGGIAFVHRKGYYDYSTISNEESLTAPTARLDAGVEFYFAPRAGIRLEMGVNYMQMPERVFNPTPGLNSNNPAIVYKSNPIAVRYASGIFFMF